MERTGLSKLGSGKHSAVPQRVTPGPSVPLTRGDLILRMVTSESDPPSPKSRNQSLSLLQNLFASPSNEPQVQTTFIQVGKFLKWIQGSRGQITLRTRSSRTGPHPQMTPSSMRRSVVVVGRRAGFGGPLSALPAQWATRWVIGRINLPNSKNQWLNVYAA
jgi:hypothetical protein